MAMNFAFWLSSQPSSVQIIVMAAMILTLVLCVVVNDKVEKQTKKG